MQIDEPNTPFRYAGELEDEQFNVTENAELSATESSKAHENTTRAHVAPVLTDQWAKLNATLEYEAQKQAGVAPTDQTPHTVFQLGGHPSTSASISTAAPSCMMPSSSQPAWKQVGKKTLSSPSKDESSLTEEERVHNEAFRKKREAHYNEFKLIQAMKRKQELKRQKRISQGKDPDESDDDEEGEDDSDECHMDSSGACGGGEDESDCTSVMQVDE